MEVSDEIHVPAPLTPGKQSPYPLDRGVGESQSRSGSEENKYISYLRQEFILSGSSLV
jgi:hypothetical protein